MIICRVLYIILYTFALSTRQKINILKFLDFCPGPKGRNQGKSSSFLSREIQRKFIRDRGGAELI